LILFFFAPFASFAAKKVFPVSLLLAEKGHYHKNRWNDPNDTYVFSGSFFNVS